MIKLLREIQLMKKFNILLDQIDEDKTEQLFVPEILDIICPDSKGLKLDLSQICVVVEYFNTDLDQLLKQQVPF